MTWMPLAAFESPGHAHPMMWQYHHKSITAMKDHQMELQYLWLDCIFKSYCSQFVAVLIE